MSRHVTRRTMLQSAIAGAACASFLAPARARADTGLTFTNGDQTLGFHIVGQGSPIVFLAGGPGFSTHYLDEIPPYLYGLSGIMLDLRGTGASSAVPLTPQTITIANCVADVETLRETLGFEKITLFAHSFGGLIAMAYANAHPDHVRGLILVDTVPPDLALEEQVGPLRRARLSPAERTRLDALRSEASASPAEALRERLRVMLPTLFSNPANAAAFEGFIDSADDYRPAVSGAFLADLSLHGRVAPLRDLRAPVLIVFGNDDPGAALVVQALREEFTKPTVIMLPSAGHFPWMEQPKAFYNVVRAFLAAQGLGGTAPH